MKQGGKIKMILNYLWLHGWKYRAIERQHKRLVRQLIREHRPINVVFMALDISLWRYQEIYELMAAHCVRILTRMQMVCDSSLTKKAFHISIISMVRQHLTFVRS